MKAADVGSPTEHVAASPVITLPPGPISAARNFRSTWIVSSLEGLRACGRFDRYQEHLGTHRDEIVHCIAGTWLPIALAREHYEACEKLGLSDSEHVQLARDGAKVRQTWNARLIAELQAPTATPWLVLPLLARTWKRTTDGGAFCAYKHGEREARATYLGCELFDVAYFRRAVGLMIHTMASYKGKAVQVDDIAERDPACASYRITWC